MVLLLLLPLQVLIVVVAAAVVILVAVPTGSLALLVDTILAIIFCLTWVSSCSHSLCPYGWWRLSLAICHVLLNQGK